MQKISFVYFDVGGVAIQDFSDSPKWDSMMDAMGIPVSRREEFDKLYHDYDTTFCLGVHEDTFIPKIASEFGLSLPEGFSMRRYFIDHFEKNDGIWPIIQKLKKTKKIGLLTDQYPGMRKQIEEKHLFPQVEWDAIVDSTEVGYRKPSREIYEIAENSAGVPGSEILFIDNRHKNLAPAIERGWQTFFYDSRDYDKANSDLIEYLQSQGL